MKTSYQEDLTERQEIFNLKIKDLKEQFEDEIILKNRELNE
jgi:hypothetical protein